jgi:hypothetical protein
MRLRKGTWLARGGVVAILAVLVGAWAVGLVGIGDASSPAAERSSPEPTDESREYDVVRAVVVEKAKERRTRDAAPALTEPSPDTVTDDPTTPVPTTPSTPDSPDPSEDPSDPSTPSTPTPSDPPSSNPPSNPPSSPPTQPAEECTDLSDVVDCVLDPITDRP